MNYPFGQPPGGGMPPRQGMPMQPFGFAPPNPAYSAPPQAFGVQPFQARPPQIAGGPTIYKAPIKLPEVQPTTIYVGNITDRYADYAVAEILSACGPMLSWKRVKGHDFKLQGFGFCEYESPGGAARASRLLNELLLGNDKKLVIKIESKTQERINDWMKNRLIQSGRRLDDVDLSNLSQFVDEKTKMEDKAAMEKIGQIITQANIAADEADASKPAIGAELPKKPGAADSSDNRRNNKDSKSYRNDRADDKSSKSKGTAESPKSPSRSPSRQRDEQAAPTANNVAATGQPEQPIDEEEAAERRRAERRAREKAERYADRLKAWESRERDKAKQYARIRDKEADTKRKQEHDARRLKQFLEDYDDMKDDPKYYRGSALSQRLKDREREIESDSRDRKREKEEMEEVRRKLHDQGCNNVDEEIERLERQTTAHLLPRLRGEENLPGHQSADISNKPVSSPVSDSMPSLDHHIQLLIHGSGDGDSNVDERSLDESGANGRQQFVPARFESIGSGGVSPKNDRKRPSDAVEEEKAVVDASGTLSVKLSVNNKAKRLAAAMSVVAAAAEMSSDATAEAKSANRLGPLPVDDGSASSSIYMTEENKKERIQQLIKSIPSAKADLFAYSLDWGQVDKLLMEKRVRPWIDKKIVEYIGEGEPTLSEFLCQKVLARTAPEKILEDIGVIFDEDADLFVSKLWRLLIYETEARKQKINIL